MANCRKQSHRKHDRHQGDGVAHFQAITQTMTADMGDHYFTVEIRPHKGGFGCSEFELQSLIFAQFQACKL